MKATGIKFSIVFVVGFLLGSTATGLYISHCMNRLWRNSGCHDHILDRISQKLNLSPDQRIKVDAILKAEDSAVNQLREDGREKFKAIRDNIDAQIRPILTPDQIKKLDQWKVERENPPTRPTGLTGWWGSLFHPMPPPPPDGPPPTDGK
jgi:Spy/CpxP family protein refolding chaperone